jgi:pimeloyl-ACP methyl ester carboxylesterase
MPYARNGLIRLYYEQAGTGVPVLLINGQGMTLGSSWRTIDVLARSFRVLAFDNRDTGRSSFTPLPYSVMQMADDAVAVLDSVDEERAHVYGISLGGIVALDLALRYPDRVQALVLGATTAGGPTAIPHDPQALTFFARVGAMAPEEAEWAAVPYTYGRATRRDHAQRIADDITRRLDSRRARSGGRHDVARERAHPGRGDPAGGAADVARRRPLLRHGRASGRRGSRQVPPPALTSISR